jgi:sporulation protein YlmC with PRC-barrel domain
MRLSELLDKEVVDGSGRALGRVHDVRASQDGPLNAGFDAQLRVQGLIIGHGGLASRIGYGRTGSRGPWLIRRVLESHHSPSFVPWTRVSAIDGDRITISGDASDLSRAEPVRPPSGGAAS